MDKGEIWPTVHAERKALAVDLRSIQPDQWHPPGPADTMLGETIIHAQDIRGPLGIPHEYPLGALVRLADFYKRQR
jgi:hypothetical protein